MIKPQLDRKCQCWRSTHTELYQDATSLLPKSASRSVTNMLITMVESLRIEEFLVPRRGENEAHMLVCQSGVLSEEHMAFSLTTSLLWTLRSRWVIYNCLLHYSLHFFPFLAVPVFYFDTYSTLSRRQPKDSTYQFIRHGRWYICMHPCRLLYNTDAIRIARAYVPSQMRQTIERKKWGM